MKKLRKNGSLLLMVFYIILFVSSSMALSVKAQAQARRLYHFDSREEAQEWLQLHATPGDQVGWPSSRLPRLYGLQEKGKKAVQIASFKENTAYNEMKTILGSNPNQFEQTKKLLIQSRFQPIKKVSLGDCNFFISKILKVDEGRSFAIAYVQRKDPQQPILARLFYKSVSDGGWRSAPAIGLSGDLTYIWKTDYSRKASRTHYTQETKPHETLVQALFRLEMHGSERVLIQELASYFSFLSMNGDRIGKQTPLSLGEERVFWKPERWDGSGPLRLLDEAQKYEPGHNYRVVTMWEQEIRKEFPAYVPKTADRNEPDLQMYFRDLVKEEHVQSGFVPDLRVAPVVRSYSIVHSILGITRVRVFHGYLGGRTIEWHMASDSSGRVWIDRLTFLDAGITTYGTPREVIDSGALTNKPLEYTAQIPVLMRSVAPQISDQYSDYGVFLDQMLPIQAYRSRFRIFRSNLDQIESRLEQIKAGLMFKLRGLSLVSRAHT